MTHNIYLYIFIMAGVSYAIRVLPLTLIKKPIENEFLKSFLYYVPYVTLAVMTFPGYSARHRITAFWCIALIIGIIAAWAGAGLLPVAVICCVVVLIAEWFL